jgi:endonuclease/exonuclease/phosphatase family metal-dependent hydrolase
MRIAAFNVENLFDRAKVLERDQPPERQAIIDGAARLTALFEKPAYSDADKAEMIALMDRMGMLNRFMKGPLAFINRVREPLLSLARGQPRIVPNGRGGWVGWVELVRQPVDEIAQDNTARVIRDVAADVLVVVEAESRPVLKKFHEILSARLGVPEHYAHIMLIDGNDDRGIDVGLGTVAGLPINRVQSHVDAMADGRPIFSRDCPVYEVALPGGQTLFVLPNHFKSKMGGNDADSRRRRLAQATEAARIYRDLRAGGAEFVVVAGDLNDTPDSDALKPLVRDTDLRDVSTHPAFTEFEFRADNGNRGIGSHGGGNDSEKIDYVLLSPALFSRVTKGGIFRKGAWPGSRPVRWETYPELTDKVHAASDHHCIWADLDL